MGRTLGYKEIKRMVLAENVLKAYESRSSSSSWADWAKENPGQADLLAEAVKHGG